MPKEITKLRMLSIDVSGSSATEAAAVLGHAIDLARALATAPDPQDASVTIKGIRASATISVKHGANT